MVCHEINGVNALLMTSSRSSASYSLSSIDNNDSLQKKQKKKPKRKVIILRIPLEISNPEDIHSVLPYVCQQEETIVAVWALPRTNKRKVCVLIESSRS